MSEDEARALKVGDILEWVPSGEMCVVRRLGVSAFYVAYTDGYGWINYDDADGFMKAREE